MVAVVVREETMAGRAIAEWVLPDLPETITARELVRLRVRESFGRPGWEAEADAACAAFAHNAFVLIAGDHQIDDLDESIDLERAHVVSFIRLTPLAGG